MNVRDLQSSEKYQKLSPEARQIVFDKVSKGDQAYGKLSPQAQEIVRQRLVGLALKKTEARPSDGKMSMVAPSMDLLMSSENIRKMPMSEVIRRGGQVHREDPGVELSRQLGYNALPGALGRILRPGIWQRLSRLFKSPEAQPAPIAPQVPPKVPSVSPPVALPEAQNLPKALPSAEGKSTVTGPSRQFVVEAPQDVVEIRDRSGNIIGHTTSSPIIEPPSSTSVSRGGTQRDPFTVTLKDPGGVKRQAIVDKATGRVTGYIQEGPHGTRQSYEPSLTPTDASDYLARYRKIPRAVEGHLRNANQTELSDLLTKAKEMEAQKLGGATDFRKAVEAELARRYGTVRNPKAAGPRIEGDVKPPTLEGNKVKTGSVFDPNVPRDAERVPTFFGRLIEKWRSRVSEKLPMERRIADKIKDSPVISLVEKFTSDLADKLQVLVGRLKGLHSLDSRAWEEAEYKAIQIFKNTGSKEQAINSLPKPLQEYARMREAFMAEEQEARRLMGLPESNEIIGPYLPRRTVEDAAHSVKVFKQTGGYGLELKTSEGNFAQHRQFDSRLEGRLHGVQYEDPRITSLFREWTGLRLRETAQLIKKLQGKVIFETREAALAASPTKNVQEFSFIPGGRKWFARTREEAIFLKHQFQDHSSSLGNLGHYMNEIFRNPNLFNPFPHFLKNMLYKFRLAGGSLRNLPTDFYEFFVKPNSELMQQFKEVMPFSESGKIPYVLMREELAKLSPSAAVRAAHKMYKAITSANEMSTTVVFKSGDPFLRYSLWKRHMSKGMTAQEAANHAWVDLIRYSTRSEAIDILKSIPSNFFVPWRYGTLVSLRKQLVSHPFRAAAFIGTVDVIREAYYRKTGRWIHLPVDYVEAPLAKLLEDPKAAGEVFKTAVNIRALVDSIGAIQGTVEWDRIRNLFWGWSQMYEIPKEWEAYSKTGDSNHLMNILTGVLLGTHSTYEYVPWRLGANISEKHMPKSSDVAHKEALVAARTKMKEAAKAREKLTRPYKTNEYRLTGQTR